MTGNSRRPPGPELLSFDLYNTLVVENLSTAEDARVEHLLRCLAAGRIRGDAGQVRTIVAEAHRRYQVAWAAGDFYPPATAAADVARDLCAAHRIGDQALRCSLAEAFLACGGDVELELVSGAIPLLAAVRAAGIHTCVVCDVGLTPSERIRSFLARRGLAELIGSVSFSDETAVYKPAPEAFLRAWRQHPEAVGARIWHVGDMRRSDVVGAARLGAVTVRFRGVYDDTDPAHREADIVIDELDALRRLAHSP